LELESI